MQNNRISAELKDTGFSIQQQVYTSIEVESIIALIHQSSYFQNHFASTNQVFAIRAFLKEVPEIFPLLFNENIKAIIKEILGQDFFIVKSIYFDKPETSNWFVAWHQDLTISVHQKADVEDYTHWTVKNGQYSVQPPVDILQSIYTLRIHLDDTDENNGALRVIPTSHKNGVIRSEEMDFNIVQAPYCRVNRGGIMLMRPLLFHASARTTNNRQRRVIHIEFSNAGLPDMLNWAEMMKMDDTYLDKEGN